jgi:hypothetical protein
MVRFNSTIEQFEKNGEKTGWTYVEISAKVADQLFPGNKKVFRVKGLLDSYPVKSVALMPRGDGSFILPVNAAMRKGIKKMRGARLTLQLERDKAKPKINAALLECLEDEPKALALFKSYAPSHQLYFSNWISAAKTEPTKVKRIAQSVNALNKGFDFGQMIRSLKQEKDELGLEPGI